MRVRISAAHRDAIYDQIVDRLTGIGDLWLAVEKEDYKAATKLAREYTDYLTLVLTDLGWGAGPGRSIELETPPDILRRVFPRLEELAAGQLAHGPEPQVQEALELEERSRLVLEACGDARAKLGDLAGSSVDDDTTGAGAS